MASPGEGITYVAQDYQNNIAILDTHILKFIKENIDESAPKSTPTIRVTYKYWEDRFLLWCEQGRGDQ